MKPKEMNDREKLRVAVEYAVKRLRQEAFDGGLGELPCRALADELEKALGPLDVEPKTEVSPREFWIYAGWAFKYKEDAQGHKPTGKDIIHVREVIPTPEVVSPRELVAIQAEDEGLWCNAKYASEAYLQQALRALHHAVESEVQPDAQETAEVEFPKADFDEWWNQCVDDDVFADEPGKFQCAHWGFNRGLEAARKEAKDGK
jgi:hypothetical protein